MPTNAASSGEDSLEVEVIVRDDAWRAAIPRIEERCAAWARRAFVLARDDPAMVAETAIVLADDALLASLNHEYRGIAGPTNVLSFPAGDGPAALPAGTPKALGDVIIAYETVCAEADHLNRALSDHLCHLVVHGILHLLGYDHKSAAEAEAMERRETRTLALFGIADPYANDDDSEG